MFCYCAEARRIARLLTARYDAALLPADLCAAHFELLSSLQALAPVNGKTLAQRIAVDTTTLSRNLRALAAQKLITQTRDAEDARIIYYALSAAGTARLKKARPLWQRAHNATEAALDSNSDKSERALKRMTRALTAAGRAARRKNTVVTS